MVKAAGKDTGTAAEEFRTDSLVGMESAESGTEAGSAWDIFDKPADKIDNTSETNETNETEVVEDASEIASTGDDESDDEDEDYGDCDEFDDDDDDEWLDEDDSVLEPDNEDSELESVADTNVVVDGPDAIPIEIESDEASDEAVDKTSPDGVEVEATDDEAAGSVPAATTESLENQECENDQAVQQQQDDEVGEQVEADQQADEGQPEDENEEVEAAQTEKESLYAIKLREAESDFAEACLEMSELEDTIIGAKEELKSQREVVKALAGKLRTIRKQGEVQLELDDIPLLQQRKGAVATESMGQDGPYVGVGDGTLGQRKSAGRAATRTKSGESKDSTDPHVFQHASSEASCPRLSQPDDWKRVPIEQLELGSIKGMGKKKLEAITDACATLGELESLRAGAGLMSISGVGRTLADAIEDVILLWLSRHRDADVLAAASEGAIKVQDESEQVQQRAAEIREVGDYQPKPGFEGAYESGKRAYQDVDRDITDCPWTPCDQQDAWIAGWLAAESLDLHE